MINTVPYCQEHENVWSPKLATVLLESCSQLESLWKYQLNLFSQQMNVNLKDKPNITDYFNYFGRDVAPSWVLFWGNQPRRISPFANWKEPEKYERRCNYEPLDWWIAFNDLKHDRFSNQDRATLTHTVNALSGLFIAIIKADFCRGAMEQANWISGDDYEPQTPLRKVHYFKVVVETSLFSYPVGWEDYAVVYWENNPPLYEKDWEGLASYRFRLWFNQQK